MYGSNISWYVAYLFSNLDFNHINMPRQFGNTALSFDLKKSKRMWHAAKSFAHSCACFLDASNSLFNAPLNSLYSYTKTNVSFCVMFFSLRNINTQESGHVLMRLTDTPIYKRALLIYYCSFPPAHPPVAHAHKSWVHSHLSSMLRLHTAHP